MSTCARCGAKTYRAESEVCSDDDDPNSESAYAITCLERQLVAQAALLRSVTRRLEFASEFLSGHHEPVNADAARAEVEAVLEVLS